MPYTEPKDHDKVMVCAECLTASCWYGEFMCDEAQGAGLVVKTVAELRKVNEEHPENWSDEKLTKIYGSASRDFRP